MPDGFPNVTSGNASDALIMVAEKGADLILEDARQVAEQRPSARPTQRAVV